MKSPILSLLFLITATVAGAQSVPDSWKVLPMQGTSITDVVETPSSVYYISSLPEAFGLDNAFFYYDKESGETGYATPGVQLSDGGVTSMYYNRAGKYTLCAYSNGNIDLMYESGKLINMPEIKDARVTGSKSINDVYFAPGKIYVATDFGLVVYDDENHVVVESSIFNIPVKKIGIMGDKLLVYGMLDANKPTTLSLFAAPLEGRHNSLERFSLVRENLAIESWIIPGEDYYITLAGTGNAATLVKVTIAPDGEFSFSNVAAVPGATKIKTCSTGYYCAGNNSIVLLDEAGNAVSTTKVDSSWLPGQVALWNTSLKEVWCTSGNKIGCYDFSGQTPTVVKEAFENEGAKTFNNAFTALSPDGTKVYINGVGQSEYHPAGNPASSFQMPVLMACYDWNTGEIESVYPEATQQYMSACTSYQNTYKINALFGGCAAIAVDPVDPSLIYHANQHQGLFLIRDREIVYRFHEKNSPLSSYNSASRIQDLAFDNEGNLWVGLWRTTTSYATSTTMPYKVLSREALELARTNPEVLEEKDASGQYKYWQQPKWVDSDHGKCDIHLAFSGDKGLKIDGSWNLELVGIDTKGTPSVSDDSYIRYDGFTDQDGNQSNPSMQGCIKVDRNGWFWIGTNAGIYVVKDLKQIGTPATTLNAIRPKVARDDGTEYADYLLASEKIYAIDVDANNNKWIATSNSGLYYVNDDGTRILGQYDKDNSPLRTNEITTVVCNPAGNDVLVGTRQGLYVYGSTASPAAADYSEVKVYPNPVCPEYTGWVNIEGLMANSLVKIADTAGNVVWSGRSEGGTCSWDGCDAAGNRVHSGVYMVFASSNNDGDSNAVVSKIVVIN